MNKKLLILHVEDDVIMGMQIKEFLEDQGYEVCDTASSGLEAIQSVLSNRPDVVLMDITLKGGINGIEATQEIRTFCDTPVIFLSGCADTGTIEKTSAIGKSLFISKPFDPVKLIVAIESFRSN